MGDTYDKSVGWDEAVMGIPLLRWSLAAQATGQVRRAHGPPSCCSAHACLEQQPDRVSAMTCDANRSQARVPQCKRLDRSLRKLSSPCMQVLEASAGTGRNVGWYSDKVEQVVFTDVSYDMLRRAKLRWEERPRPYDAAFVLSDVQALATVRLAPGGGCVRASNVLRAAPQLSCTAAHHP